MEVNKLIDLSDQKEVIPRAEIAASEVLVVNASELTPLNEFGSAPQRGPLKTLSSIGNGSIYVVDGVIRDIGNTDEVRERLDSNAAPLVIDATGCAIVPGFIDPHSHMLYEGSRADEYASRIAGASYDEISALGGGVKRTIQATVGAADQELLRALTGRLNQSFRSGTTTAEVKTGYWVSAEGELRALALIGAASDRHPIDLVPTYHLALGIPEQFENNSERLIEFVINKVLPHVRTHADFFDVVCDAQDIGGLSTAQCRKLLSAATNLGLGLKIHADEFTPAGGGELAAEFGAVSADHLCYLGEHTVQSLAAADTVAVILPVTRHYLLAPCLADARRLIDAGVPVALGTDHGPSSPCTSMPFVMGLACSQLRMDPAEALVAATWNAAWAIGRADSVGCLQIGRQADFLVLGASSYRELPYFIDRSLVRATVKKGGVFMNLPNA